MGFISDVLTGIGRTTLSLFDNPELVYKDLNASTPEGKGVMLFGGVVDSAIVEKKKEIHKLDLTPMSPAFIEDLSDRAVKRRPEEITKKNVKQAIKNFKQIYKADWSGFKNYTGTQEIPNPNILSDIRMKNWEKITSKYHTKEQMRIFNKIKNALKGTNYLSLKIAINTDPSGWGKDTPDIQPPKKTATWNVRTFVNHVIEDIKLTLTGEGGSIVDQAKTILFWLFGGAVILIILYFILKVLGGSSKTVKIER